MSDYKFTKDWFSWAPPIWEQVFKQMPIRQDFLEIGSFEGRSTVWLVENALEDGGEIVCVDTWEGGEEHVRQGVNMNYAEQNFDYNMRVLKDNFQNRWVDKVKAKSKDALIHFHIIERTFDFIYIDGSHVAADVMTDACLAWPLLKPGGVMVFDDYRWGEPIPETHKPKLAVDAFIAIFQEQLYVVNSGYQMIIQKREK